MTYHNKLVCLSLSVSSTLIYFFAGKARALKVGYFRGANRVGSRVFVHNSLEQKRLSVTSTLDYYDVQVITDIKRFIVKAPLGFCENSSKYPFSPCRNLPPRMNL